jgi:K+-transporting ATPase ATPase A chain
MKIHDWLQLFFFFLIVIMIARMLGAYLTKVLNYDQRTGLEWLFEKLENFLYKIMRLNPDREQSGKEYLKSLLWLCILSFVFTFALFYLQAFLPLNPMHIGSPSWHLCFNTTSSFVTNTCLESYIGEKDISYFSQMAVMTVQNFLSPCYGLCAATALVRALARTSCSTVGNFWRDFIRLILYFFLPLSFILSIFLVCGGVPQNFSPYVKAIGIDSQKEQIIVQGPIATQCAIKLLGSNGGGFTKANAAHPYENPSAWINFWQMIAILAIPAAQFNFFAREVNNKKHGRCLLAVMMILFIIGIWTSAYFEYKGNPNISKIAGQHIANMEGKETRFDVFASSLFAVTTTAVSNGSTNSNHEAYTPVGMLPPLLNMQLGEIIFGGVGSGLYSMILFIILTIFLAGLIVGRTPEYLGKKFGAYEVKMSVFALIAFFVAILGFTSLAISCVSGKESIFNLGPHGFTEILYSFTAAVANNGSAFDGLKVNTPFYNVTLGFAMLMGRFMVMIPMLKIADSLVKKQKSPQGIGTLQVGGIVFGVLLFGIIVLLGALTFIPSFVMGPILEQFYMMKGVLF